MQTFHSTKPERVYYFHYFDPEKFEEWGLNGATVAVVRIHNKLAAGVALCSCFDQFSRKRGCKIALGRALRDAVKSGIYSPNVTEIHKIRELAEETLANAVLCKENWIGV